MSSYTSAALVGLLVGVIIAYAYHHYFARKMTSARYIALITICNLVAASACLAVLAYSKPHTRHVKHSYTNFATETFFVSALSAATLFVIMYMRNIPINNSSWYEFGLIFAKIMVIHVLFELTGFYKFVLG